MSEAVKKRHIEIKIGSKRPKLYLVPKEKAKGVEQLLEDYLVENLPNISADEVFQELDSKYSKAGNVLTGFRLKEQLTQSQLAKKAATSQPVIAAIENGKRKVGKQLAQKLAKVFKTDYRVFLV